MSKIVPRRFAGRGRIDRVAAVLSGALLSATALVGPVRADDTDGQVASQGLTQEQEQKLISNLQDLSKADSSQAEMQEGFAIASTFSDIAGQPEVGFAISGLQQLAQFSGIFSSGSTNATSEAIATLTKDVAQIKSDLDRLNSVVANNAAVQAAQYNQGMLKNVYDANQKLNDIAAQFYPASPGSSVGNATNFCKLNGSCPPAAAPVVTPALLEQIAGVMNEFIDQQKNYFIGDDLDAGNKVIPGFKPQPALNVYLASVRMYLGAMTAYAHGNPSVILNDRGTAQRKPFVYDLKRHLAFLRAQASGGSNPAGLPPQDQITNAIGCEWSGSSAPQGGQYPDASGQCVSIGAVCRDNISRRKLVFGRNDIKGIDLHLSWQQDRNAFCSPPSGAPLEQLEALLFAKYGLPAMNGTASLLEHMARTGSPADVTHIAGSLGGSGGVKGSTFFVYGTGALGAVNLYSGAPGGGLMKPLPEGFIPEATALLPGGSSVFYALTKDGTLNWYRFHPGDKNQKPFDGPVAVGSNLTGYTRIFGGGDGVIYAIRTDGSLVWFRHTGFMTGTGSLSQPKVINAGWGSFKNVFSAGSGVIYAVRSDGGLVWYRHRDYLTGDSKDATPPPAARGTTAHPTARNMTTVGNSLAAAANAALVAHFDGPTDVGSGWADFKRVIPAGDGVLLALRSDGRLDWYRHQDYLTGTSTNGTSTPNAPGSAIAPANSSVWGAPSAATGPGARSYGATGNTAALGMAAPGAPATTFGSASYRAQTPGGTRPATTSALGSNSYASHFGGSPQAGGHSPGQGSHTVYGATAHLTFGTPHWDGPRTVEAHTELGALNAIAAPLPATDLGSTNGLH